MRSDRRNVKRLAPPRWFWHRFIMSSESEAQQKARSERLRQALRANLRRRKAKNEKQIAADTSSPKSAD